MSDSVAYNSNATNTSSNHNNNNNNSYNNNVSKRNDKNEENQVLFSTKRMPKTATSLCGLAGINSSSHNNIHNGGENTDNSNDMHNNNSNRNNNNDMYENNTTIGFITHSRANGNIVRGHSDASRLRFLLYIFKLHVHIYICMCIT